MESNAKVPSRPYKKTSLYVRARPGLKLRDKKVERLVRKMRNVMSWLEPCDLPACRAWAEMEYLCGQVYAVLASTGVFTQGGEEHPKIATRRLLDDYRKLRQTQAVFARELGMTPAARMAIKANGTRAPFDLASAMVEHVVEVGESRARSEPAVAETQSLETEKGDESESS
jgi:hypothetical protein